MFIDTRKLYCILSYREYYYLVGDAFSDGADINTYGMQCLLLFVSLCHVFGHEIAKYV